jgi:NADP-dependent 3-hydroxy acid dehydrogenase YdfG
MDALAGNVAVVTGASNGIGRAIALNLAEHGATLCLVGRHRDRLTAVAAACSASVSRSIHVFEADLGEDDAVRRLAHAVEQQFQHVDILVHCAGVYGRGALREASIEQLDLLYRVNVRGPYLLTQLLLAPLTRRRGRGQIVFVNSTQGLNAAADVGQFAATQHALKAIADSLRQELNPDGVRVLSVYPGRTATPRTESVHKIEHKAYQPELLLQPHDIAAVVVNALELPRTAEVTNITIRPLQKSY